MTACRHVPRHSSPSMEQESTVKKRRLRVEEVATTSSVNDPPAV